ncbi:uncharacterized protein [Periplaneta americana]|uniref:uncharacterized protein n=1 Tax=Periplaneta americana TaxID=6978 RepID=UPI0037E95069
MAVSRTLLAAIAAVLCFAQVLEAGTVKRSTESGSIANQLQEAATRAQEAVNNVTHELGLDNLPSAESVAQNLHNQTLQLASKMGQLVGQLHNEASSHQDDLSGILQSIANKWNETAATLQSQNSEVSRTAQELQTSFSTGLQSFFAEAQKLVQAISPHAESASTNLQEVARTALDRVQETANEFRTSLQQTTASHS